MTTPNRPTEQGRELGAQLNRITEPIIQDLVAAGEPDERCASCAFRLGTVPNGCAPTVADALKCVMEGVEFNCHSPERKGLHCHGWYAGRVAMNGERRECFWPFSDEPGDYEPETAEATA